MFDLSFYKLIKWVLNLEDDTNEYFQQKYTARTHTDEMFRDVRFSILVLGLTIKENTNISNLDRYMSDYFEYFM